MHVIIRPLSGRPLFTSRSEWLLAERLGERAYVRSALGYLVRGSLLGFSVLIGPVGAADPYWRTWPVLAVFGLSLAGLSACSALLFRREWRAASRRYFLAEPGRESAP